jgi:hypothetical protein
MPKDASEEREKPKTYNFKSKEAVANRNFPYNPVHAVTESTSKLNLALERALP